MKKIYLVGLLLLAVGAIVLAAYGLYHFLRASEIPLIVRMAAAGILVGIGIMLYSLIRERLKEVRK
jgi:hypothetical protein